MRVLLDTHTFLWALDNDAKLSATARALIDNPATERLLSAASVWEIAIKHSLGKLTVRAAAPLAPTLLRQITDHQIIILPLSAEHALGVAELPFHHKDPFDRVLVAQCLAERLPVLSADAELDAYGVRRIW